MSVRAREDSIRHQTFETVIAWDADGVEILRKDGEQYRVVFSDEEVASLRGAVLTHNHPRGLEYLGEDPRSFGNSFSREDFHLACHAQLAEIRVVTPRLRFSLRPPALGWDTRYWEETLGPAYARHKAAVSQEMRSAIQSGTIPQAEAESRHFHEICLRVADELGLEYVREEN